MKLTDDHFQTFVEQGFVVVENFYPEERRAQIAAAIRQTLPPWEVIAADPPARRRLTDDFPYADMLFNEFILDWDLIEFVQRVLDTEDIFFRYAHNWARYPDPGAEPAGPAHRQWQQLAPAAHIRPALRADQHLVLPRSRKRRPSADANRA